MDSVKNFVLATPAWIGTKLIQAKDLTVSGIRWTVSNSKGIAEKVSSVAMPVINGAAAVAGGYLANPYIKGTLLLATAIWVMAKAHAPVSKTVPANPNTGEGAYITFLPASATQRYVGALVGATLFAASVLTFNTTGRLGFFKTIVGV